VRVKWKRTRVMMMKTARTTERATVMPVRLGLEMVSRIQPGGTVFMNSASSWLTEDVGVALHVFIK
jgi:hypothetical protein